MTRHSYHERDYAFGQVMLKLRTSMGLTQAGLAHLLGVSRRAVGEWEAGSNYPKAERMQHFLELCVQQRAFAPGQEEEEIRTLWKTAHQRELLDGSGSLPCSVRRLHSCLLLPPRSLLPRTRLLRCNQQLSHALIGSERWM
jgi:transcriptional regulator with XRE-family HTH domain